MDHHPHHHHQHHPHHQQQQQQHHHHPQNHQQHHPPPHLYPPNSTFPHMISSSNSRFPFTSPVLSSPQPTQPSAPSPLPHHTPPLDPNNSPFSGSASGYDPNSQKKKRGRPRKYSPDGSGGGGGGSGIALGLSPTPVSSSALVVSCQADSGGPAPSSDNAAKKNRGRPSGSSKKQLDALGNCGVGFTPHVILVNAGEDIASKIEAFSKQGPRTVCVLSANGSICNVDLRQTGGIVNYEGRYEIISLSGSFLFSENNGGQVRTGGLSVSLAGPDGRVLGGGVVGVLRAASSVQIIVGSFIADGKKVKYMPSVPQSHMLSFAAPQLPAADSSPPSQEVSTEGSDENGSNHIDRNIGSYGNSNHPMHHHNMQMYSQMAWPSSASKMLQH